MRLQAVLASPDRILLAIVVGAATLVLFQPDIRVKSARRSEPELRPSHGYVQV